MGNRHYQKYNNLKNETFTNEFSLVELWTSNIEVSRVIYYFIINVKNCIISSVEVIFLPFKLLMITKEQTEDSQYTEN